MFLRSDDPSDDDVERLGNLHFLSAAEMTALLLLHLGKVNPHPGSRIIVEPGIVDSALRRIAGQKEDEYAPDAFDTLELAALEMLGVTGLSTVLEFDWVVTQALHQGGFLRQTQSTFKHAGRPYHYRVITPAGWNEFARLQQVNAESRIGFIAMSFQQTFIPLLTEGIEPGIREAGFEPQRVDKVEFNDHIDDEIIARIKASRFVVADFTMQRGGIYFEAGYALGMGLRVIWIVREDALKDVHFDNRQYNFITWREGAWADLRKRLRFRIEATIGKGPLVAATSA